MTEIVASDLILLGGRGEGAVVEISREVRAEHPRGGSNNFDQRTPEPEPAPAGPITDEDIPF